MNVAVVLLSTTTITILLYVVVQIVPSPAESTFNSLTTLVLGWTAAFLYGLFYQLTKQKVWKYIPLVVLLISALVVAIVVEFVIPLAGTILFVGVCTGAFVLAAPITLKYIRQLTNKSRLKPLYLGLFSVLISSGMVALAWYEWNSRGSDIMPLTLP